MAELETLGAVASICQVIDYGQKLISSAVQIYHSASGTSVVSSETELIEKDFADVRDKIRGSIEGKSENDQFSDLCIKCDDIATDLLDELGKLKIKEGKKKFGRAVQCIWKATKEAWGHDYVEAQKKRLSDLKNELHLRVTVDIR